MSALESKNGPLNDGHLRVRLYNDGDLEQVRNLVVRGLCEGEGSSLQVGLKSLFWQPIVALSYPCGLIGLAILFTAGGDPLKLLVGLAVCAFPPLWVKLWRHRLSKGWDVYVRQFLDEGDMVDVGRFYAVDKPKDNDDGGASAFWVVEATEGGNKRVVGCIGLDSRGQTDKTWSELRRLSISEDYRRRGMALILIRTLYSHARERGVQRLTLSTTTYQKTAIDMYKRLGWVEVKKVPLGGPLVRNFHLHHLELGL